jgi:hypothetical protein
MPRFTVRVELHKAEDEPGIYKKLHTAMEKKGFSRTIVRDKVTLELPTAEYHNEGEKLTGEVILEDAKAAAKTVWEDFSVLVTETEKPKLVWNLKQVK